MSTVMFFLAMISAGMNFWFSQLARNDRQFGLSVLQWLIGWVWLAFAALVWADAIRSF